MKTKISILLTAILILSVMPVSASYTEEWSDGYILEGITPERALEYDEMITQRQKLIDEQDKEEGIWTYKNIKLYPVPNEQVKQELIKIIDEALLKFYTLRTESRLLAEAFNKAKTSEEITRASHNLQQFYHNVEVPMQEEIAQLTYKNPFFKQFSPDNNIYYHLETYINQADQLIQDNKTTKEVKENPAIEENVKAVFDVRSRFQNTKQIPDEAFSSNHLVITLNKITDVQNRISANYDHIVSTTPSDELYERFENDKLQNQLLQELEILRQDKEVIEFYNQYNNRDYNFYDISNLAEYHLKLRGLK